MDQSFEQFVETNDLRSPQIIRAFERVKRQDFLPPDIANQHLVNSPLPIGAGQTNSQPYTVALMLELLDPQEGQKILDVGSGSGWTTALLAEIVGPTGQVDGLEIISELKEFGENNCKKYSFSNVEFFCQDGYNGLPDSAPFDRILVSAAAIEIPQALLDQLKIGGRMVIPTEAQDIRVIEKITATKFKEEIYQDFIFVPLIKTQD